MLLHTKKLVVPGCWRLMPVILATWRQRFEGFWFLNCHLRQIVLETLLRKYPKQKRIGGITEVVEHLSNKHEALSSRPSDDQKKKNQKLVVMELGVWLSALALTCHSWDPEFNFQHCKETKTETSCHEWWHRRSKPYRPCLKNTKSNKLKKKNNLIVNNCNNCLAITMWCFEIFSLIWYLITYISVFCCAWCYFRKWLGSFVWECNALHLSHFKYWLWFWLPQE
jgi:hypothetical protein